MDIDLPGLLSDPRRGLHLVQVASDVAWADRRLAADEVAATRGVATVLGVLEPSAGLLLRGPRRLAHAEVSAAMAGCRDVVYVTALWVALADGVLAPAEREVLDALARSLRIDPERREMLDDLVWSRAGTHTDWAEAYASVLCAVPVS